MLFRRRKFIVDPKLQYAVAVYVGGSLLAVAAIYVGALLIFGGNEYQPHTGEEVRGLMIQMSLVFASLAALHMVALALMLTHRIAGPMRVLEKAIRGLREGDYERRMTLRKRDYLHTLAAELQSLAEHLQEKDRAVEDVERCLAEKDHDAAREIVARLRGKAEPAPEPAAT